MAKPVAKTVCMGFRLDVYKIGPTGDMVWESGPWLFRCKDEAMEYKNRKHPTVTRFRIYRVRLPAPEKNQQFSFIRSLDEPTK